MEKSPTGMDRGLTLPAKVESITAVTAFLEQELDAIGCPVKEKMQICVAADEIVTNIAMYAYTPGSGELTVRFAFDEEHRTAEITFTDEGIRTLSSSSLRAKACCPISFTKSGTRYFLSPGA